MTMKSSLSASLAVVSIALMFAQGEAAVKIWDGNSSSGTPTNWGSAINWLDDAVPAANDDLIFGWNYRTINFNDLTAGTVFRSLWFSNSTWRLDGNGLRLTAGLTNTVASGTQIIGLAVTTAAAQVWHNAALNAVVQFNSNAPIAILHSLELTGAGQFHWFGVITGTAPLRVSLRGGTAAGIAELYVTNGANTFSGPVTIDDSNRVRVAAASRITSGTITVTNGGQLYLVGATNLGTVVISGGGFRESSGILGALRLDGGSLVRGAVVLSNDARIHTHSGDATIFGPIHGAYVLEKSGVGSLQVGNVTNTGFTGRWVVTSNG